MLITLWDEMKEKLKEKYFPPYYLSDQLYHQFFKKLRQDIVIVTEYMAKFKEFTIFN